MEGNSPNYLENIIMADIREALEEDFDPDLENISPNSISWRNLPNSQICKQKRSSSNLDRTASKNVCL